MKLVLSCLLIATLLFAGCAETTVSSISAGSLAGMRRDSVYVPNFSGETAMQDDGNLNQATTAFVADLTSKAHLLVVRGNSIAQDGPSAANGSYIADTDAGMANARQAGAGLLVSGKVVTKHTAEGYTATTIVQVIMLASGTTVTRLRQDATAPDERQAIIASARQAAAALAEGF